MQILFCSGQDPHDWNDSKRLVRRQSAHRAKLIRRRLDDMRAAPTLEAMRNLPGRCHELRGNRGGQLSIDLDGPYRLLFQVGDDPVPLKPDGGLDWTKVTTIIVLGVENTHE
jgi:plasmid maintenance system killer protein